MKIIAKDGNELVVVQTKRDHGFIANMLAKTRGPEMRLLAIGNHCPSLEDAEHDPKLLEKIMKFKEQ